MLPRRILVAYDFVGPSKRACDHALELAGALGASLCLVHVVERFDIPLTDAERGVILDGARQELERAANRLRGKLPALTLETRVVEGPPAPAIDAAADEWGADLVVMGTHGRRGIARALLGSVAGRVLRTSAVPAMTVPEYVAISRNAAGTRLAVALRPLEPKQPRFVALSRGALPIARTLAAALDGTIDFWGVEQLVTSEGVVIGAIGEDEKVELEPVASSVNEAAREHAVASARSSLRVELLAVKGTQSIGECSELDVVLVADGLFGASYVRGAVTEIRKLGARRVMIASPVVSHEVFAQLEGIADGVIALETAILADACVYRDDVVPTDTVARELLMPSALPSKSGSSPAVGVP